LFSQLTDRVESATVRPVEAAGEEVPPQTPAAPEDPAPPPPPETKKAKKKSKKSSKKEHDGAEL
jgi:hypothetical protein